MPEPEPAAPEAAGPDTRRRRLLFRATHRGTHETDLLIGGFVVAHLLAFTDEELDALEEILEWPDVEMADYLTGRLPIPPERDHPMLRRMREAALNGFAMGRPR